MISAAVEAKMIAAAERAVRSSCKMRVRKFIRMPSALETITPGLSYASGAMMVAVAESMMAVAAERPCQRLQIGGDVPLINLRALRWYGRALRIYERGTRRVAA